MPPNEIVIQLKILLFADKTKLWNSALSQCLECCVKVGKNFEIFVQKPKYLYVRFV